MNMGIEPFLVATSVHLICAQRLIRRICKDCAEPVEMPVQALIDEGFTPEEAKTVQIMKGKGCTTCNKTGYKGRTGLYEVMEVMMRFANWFWSALRRSNSRRRRLSAAMITLRRSGLIKVAARLDHARRSGSRNDPLRQFFAVRSSHSEWQIAKDKERIANLQ